MHPDLKLARRIKVAEVLTARTAWQALLASCSG